MGGLLAYSGLTTKIRAMQSRLITNEQYNSIVQLSTVTDVVEYLRRIPSYDDVLADLTEEELHRGKIERQLRRSIYRDFTKIYQFSNGKQRKFLDLYFRRYEITFIKNCLNRIMDYGSARLAMTGFEEFFRKHSKLDLEKLMNSSTLDEFVANLKGSDFYTPLIRLQNVENPTLFDYEMAIDLYYFNQIWKQKDKFFRKKDLEEMTLAYGSKFDIINTQWIYRCKKYYHMDSTDIYALLIPVYYRLKPETITRLVEAESLEQFDAVMAQTYYGKHYDNFSTAELDNLYVYVMKHILAAESRRNPYSIATLYCYLYFKDHEVQRLTIALECVRYKVPPAEAIQYIMKA